MENSNTLGVLRQLERGEISATEADARLNRPPEIDRDDDPPFEETGAPEWAQRLWFYPLTAGVLLVLLGAWISAATVDTNVLWLVLGLPIILLGSFLVAIAASAQSGHWIYVNIRGMGWRRHTIHFGIPFPLGLIRIALWTAQWFVDFPVVEPRLDPTHSYPKFDWSDASSLIAELERELSRRGITVDVDDQGGQVQVHIV